jgi:hypothetical protein
MAELCICEQVVAILLTTTAVVVDREATGTLFSFLRVMVFSLAGIHGQHNTPGSF